MRGADDAGQAGGCRSFLGGVCLGHAGEPLEAFGFGDSAELADELAALVLAGTKRATAGAVAEWAARIRSA